MKKLGFVVVTMLVFLTACSGQGTSDGADSNRPEMPQMIDVSIFTVPELLEPGEPVNIKAKVTLNEQDVDDADEVVFEIWEEGHEDNSEKIEGQFDGDGTYSVTKTFDQGVYYVVSHVTLREVHNMPKLKLVVGDVEGEDRIQEQVEQDHDMDDMGDMSGHEEVDNNSHQH